MALSLRQREIMEIARSSGQVLVDALALRFDVSPQTIRRDLGELCDTGLLQRVHGGAVLESGVSNLIYETRRAIAREEKEAIGRACAAAVPNGASLILTIGTTTEAVARALGRHRDLLVVTNNLNVAHILSENPDCEVIVAGGRLRRSDAGVIGESAAAFLGRFKADIAVIGVSAIDPEGSLLDFDLSEAQVTRAALANARRRVLVADHTKFSRAAPVRVAEIETFDAIVTDRAPPAPFAALCAEAGVQVEVAMGHAEDSETAGTQAAE
ncbi:MAG: DeoR/GlpR family DNA-binding transcription regulator [Pseudomonadota bacterium]